MDSIHQLGLLGISRLRRVEDEHGCILTTRRSTAEVGRARVWLRFGKASVPKIEASRAIRLLYRHIVKSFQSRLSVR